MSELLFYICPNTQKEVLFDSFKNVCPYCNISHLFPNNISRKKDDKWHKNNNMWIDKNRKNKNKYKNT